MSKCSITTLLFDLDNTLVDYQLNSKNAFEISINKYKHEFLDKKIELPTYDGFYKVQKNLSINQRNKMILPPHQWRIDCFSKLLQPRGANRELINRIVTSYAEIRNQPIHLNFQVVKCLRYLREKWCLNFGILTKGFTEIHSEDSGLFLWVIRAIHVGIKKPETDFFRRSLKIIGKEQKEILYVSDDFHNDAIGARKIGIKVAIISSKFKKLPQDVLRLSSVVELRSVIAQHLGLDNNYLKVKRVFMNHREDDKDGLAAFIKRLRSGQTYGIVWVSIENPMGKILLIRRKKEIESWGFLSGEVRCGENWEIAALREIFEEVSINVSNLYLAATVTLRLIGLKQTVEVPGRLFKIRLSETPKLKINTDEVFDANFFRISEAQKLNMFSENWKILNIINEDLS